MMNSCRKKWKVKSLDQEMVEVLRKEAVLMGDREVTERHTAEYKENSWKLLGQTPCTT